MPFTKKESEKRGVGHFTIGRDANYYVIILKNRKS